MTYRPLGGGRKYVRFDFYDSSGNFIRSVNIKGQSVINKKFEGEEIVLENGELCISSRGHRAEVSVTLFNVETSDSSNLSVVLFYCNGVTHGQYKLMLYPDYDDTASSSDTTFTHFWVYPVGDVGKGWIHDYLPKGQIYSLTFRSVNYVHLQDFPVLGITQ